MSANSIPQPRPLPLVGNVRELDPDKPIQSMVALARRFGPIFRLSFPHQSLMLLGSHELVADACDETRFDKIVHASLQQLRAFAGDGLFTARTDEPNWGKAHRLLMPAFGPAAMRGYFDDMLEICDQMLVKWARLGPSVDIDVTDNMTRLTLDTIALSGFGFRFNSFYQREMHPFVDAMLGALLEAGKRTRRLPMQNRIMFLAQRQFDAHGRFMHEICDELIAHRRREPSGARDLLALMLDAVDPITGERLDDENIRYQLLTFLIAGHETTSGLLSFATWLLLANPDVLARARAHVDDMLGTRTPRFEDVARLGFIDQILRETLRLYPTAPAFAVHAKQPTLLAGTYPVDRDDVLFVLLPVLHRDPAVWPDPDTFDPDRFAPETRERIPTHGWKPFGNGQRSCIGRSFALQEATLVLAMTLQRFDLEFATGRELSIKEALTMKPAGFAVRARPRLRIATVGRAEEPAPLPPTPDAALVDAAPRAAHGTPLVVLYGSNTGTSEAFARRIASDAIARGYTAEVATLDDRAGAIDPARLLVIVTASYNGEPPDNARRFCAWLHALEPGALRGLRYAVFGCGNREWASTYQAVPQQIDAALARAGGTALRARGEGDARADLFGDFDRWYGDAWTDVDRACGVRSEHARTALYRIETVADDRLERGGLQLATVVDNRELVDMTSPFARSKRHLELDLPEGLAYEAGDYLAVLPSNHPDVVERAARRFGVRRDAAIVLRSTRGAMSASLPIDRPLSIEDLLARHVELGAPATRGDVARLAACNPCPPHRAHLEALAGERFADEILAKRMTILDLLMEFPSCSLGLAELLELLPPMRLRQYSISSSPRRDPRSCTLTVAVVDAPAWSGHGRFRGACSTYLARLRPGDAVAVAVRAPTAPFHPPADNATPMILVGAGTGIAPLRGFIHDRALRDAPGPTLLFFGCDHPDVDFLYRDEWPSWVEVFAAFAHAPDGDIRFVQHRLWRERERVRALLADGAHVYLCGDGAHMAPAVRETLARIHDVGELERAGRFVADVFA
jgi:cytochrome P450/NADPH-cytochrome P450 reductase